MAPFDKAQDRLRQARDEQAPRPARREVRRARVRWSPGLGERFLAILRETGNARQAAIRLGAPNAFTNKMKRDPEFRRRALEAAAEADERLRGYEGPFLLLPKAGPGQAIEYKSMPPEEGDGGPPGGRRKPPRPPGHRKTPLPTDPAELGGFLRPGRKRRPSEPQPVLRRNAQGRMQVTLAREGHMTAETEADFLALLRATGNFDASARAVGFQPASLHERERKWPAFARACADALAEADVALTYKLTGLAHALLRRPGEAAQAGIEEEEAPFDPVMAMKILAHIDARKYGRSGKGRRKGAAEKSFEQSCRSILDKIEAIERHEQMMAERRARRAGESGGNGDPADGAEGGDGGAD